MTIINPNSIAGITSLTAEAGVMNFYKSDGTLAGLQLNGVNFNTTSGISTFNDVYVGGTITYEDVKNVDSVGIITARDHINIVTDNKKLQLGASADLQVFHDGGNSWVKEVGTGALYIDSDGSAIKITKGGAAETMAVFYTDGAVELYHNNSKKFSTTSSGVDCPDQLQVDGTIFATGGLKVNADNQKIRLGASDDLEIFHDGSHSRISAADGGDGRLIISGRDGSANAIGLQLNAEDSKEAILCKVDGAVELFHNASKKLETSSYGTWLGDNSRITLGGSAGTPDCHFYADSNNTNLQNITGDLIIKSNSDGDKAIVVKNGAATELYYDNAKKLETTSSGIEIFGQIQMDDGNILRLGNDGDMQLYHTGSHSHVSDRGGAGNLQIESNNAVTIKQNDNESYCAKFFIGAASELYHNNVFTITTTSTGVRIPDSKALELGNRNSGGVQGDLRLYHDGSNSYIDEIGSGNLYIRNNTENAIFCQTDGFVKLYYDGSQRLETTSAGVLVSGSLTADGGNAITLGDDKKIVLGTGSDFQMWHDSSNNKTIFKENGSGSFDIRGNTIQLQDAGGNENLAIFTPNGGCTFKYDNSTKLITESTGINVTGRTTWTGGTDAATQSVYISAGSNNPTQIGMFNGYGAKQGFCFYNNGSSSYTSWGMITDQQNWYLKTAAYNIGNTSDLSSNWTDRLEVSNSGVFTVNPGGRVHVRGGTTNGSQDTVMWIDKQNNNDWLIKLECGTGSSTDYACYVRANNSANYAFAVHNLSAWKFRVAGNGTIYSANTSVQSISDVRLKDNIVDANSQWDDIKALRFRNFKWKADSGHADGITYLGLIAQEVEPISPNLVEIDAQDKEDKENGVPDPEYKNVKYSIVWMKAVKALQEAQARIETLEAEVAALKSS